MTGRSSVTRLGVVVRGRAPGIRFDNVVGALFHFVVNAAQVFPENSNSDELYSSNKKQQRHQCRESCLSCFHAQNASNREESADRESGRRDEQSAVSQQAKRQMRKAEEPIKRVPHEALKRLLRHPA